MYYLTNKAFLNLTLLTLLLFCISCATQRTVTVNAPVIEHIILSVETTTGRAIPIRAIYPATTEPDPLGVIIFSHGAFSDYDKYDRVADEWAGSGFIVFAIRHIDSPQNPLNKTYPMEQQWQLRLEDMQTVTLELDSLTKQIEDINREINTDRLVIAGHSYGAITAMALAGAVTTDRTNNTKIRVPDPGVRAIIAMSPPGLIPNYIDETSFEQMSAPLLLQTGTADVLENFIPNWEMHKAAFELSPAGNKWLAVGKNVDHYFGGLSGRFNLENVTPQREALASFISLSKLFLSAYANEDNKSVFLLKRKAAENSWSETISLEYR